MPANPEAIAWYLRRSEDLLDELHRRVQSLSSRAGQLAGFSGAILALAGANADPILGALHGSARVCAGAALLLGVLLLIASFMTALLGVRLRKHVSDIAAGEVANYLTDRFIEEPDLWRVHVRMIRALLTSIEATTRQGDEAAQAVDRAERLFSVGLSAVGIAFAILVLVVTI